MRPLHGFFFVFAALLSIDKNAASSVNEDTTTARERNHNLRGEPPSDSLRRLGIFGGIFNHANIFDAVMMSRCPGGTIDSTNNFCSEGGGNGGCPEGYACMNQPNERTIICCAQDRLIGGAENKCINGTEIPDITCGRSPERTKCPGGSVCEIDELDRFAVCCAPDEVVSVTAAERCIDGIEIPDTFCGRGLNSEKCPGGSVCEIDELDRYAVCCTFPPSSFPPSSTPSSFPSSFPSQVNTEFTSFPL